MKIKTEVSAEKLRGGFYSPAGLVDVCLDRVQSLLRGRARLMALEPTAGDGEFIRGLRRHPVGDQVVDVQAVEVVAAEAAKCQRALLDCGFSGSVHTSSFLSWSQSQHSVYDLALGNPPFLRFQFVTPADRSAAGVIAAEEGISFSGVSNLWIPVFISTLRLLRDGGAFAFIIPTECFTGVSAGVARRWLLANCVSLRADLFSPGSFPGVLQEVLILSGVRCMGGVAKANALEICEYATPRSLWTTPLEVSPANWTQCLLEPTQRRALNSLRSLHSVSRLSAVAKFEVAAVTGANAFFSVDATALARYELGPWSVPLLPRIKHAIGLRYTDLDHEQTVMSGSKASLLDFSASRPDPTSTPAAAAYLAEGEATQLPLRFKCRIREPWYRVPNIRPGRLMMSKRSHRYPRVVENDAGVVTTDTIYRGNMRPGSVLGAADFVGAFHNSLTLLSAELEGRSFGGGVLELVPSEIGRLLVPIVPGFGEELDRLDGLARERVDGDGEALVEETDRLLRKQLQGPARHAWDEIVEARLSLLNRRLDRSEP